MWQRRAKCGHNSAILHINSISNLADKMLSVVEGTGDNTSTSDTVNGLPFVNGLLVYYMAIKRWQ